MDPMKIIIKQREFPLVLIMWFNVTNPSHTCFYDFAPCSTMTLYNVVMLKTSWTHKSAKVMRLHMFSKDRMICFICIWKMHWNGMRWINNILKQYLDIYFSFEFLIDGHIQTVHFDLNLEEKARV